MFALKAPTSTRGASLVANAKVVKKAAKAAPKRASSGEFIRPRRFFHRDPTLESASLVSTGLPRAPGLARLSPRPTGAGRTGSLARLSRRGGAI